MDSTWLSEMDVDSSIFMDQCNLLDSFDEEVAALLIGDFENCLSAGQNSNSVNNLPSTNSITSFSTPSSIEPPPKQSSNFQTPHTTSSSSSTPIILNFGNVKPFNNDNQEQSKRGQKTKKTNRIRPPSQTYDHLIAERRRREQLSQGFITLSTIIPGLKKMDKTSVLGDAIKYLKQLQERVKFLEEQATMQTVQSSVFVKKSQITTEGEIIGNSIEHPLPEIEAKICNNTILFRVQCEKKKGVLLNLLNKLEKLNLAVVNINVTTFGSLSLDITIIAEMEKDFNLTMKEVIKGLLAAVQSTA